MSVKGIIKRMRHNGALTEKEFNKIMRKLDTIPQWIPCSERLPETSEHVLATLKYSEDDLEVCEVDWFIDTNLAQKAVAWMPLPEPYRKETNNEM